MLSVCRRQANVVVFEGNSGVTYSGSEMCVYHSERILDRCKAYVVIPDEMNLIGKTSRGILIDSAIIMFISWHVVMWWCSLLMLTGSLALGEQSTVVRTLLSEKALMFLARDTVIHHMSNWHSLFLQQLYLNDGVFNFGGTTVVCALRARAQSVWLFLYPKWRTHRVESTR